MSVKECRLSTMVRKPGRGQQRGRKITGHSRLLWGGGGRPALLKHFGCVAKLASWFSLSQVNSTVATVVALLERYHVFESLECCLVRYANTYLAFISKEHSFLHLTGAYRGWLGRFSEGGLIEVLCVSPSALNGDIFFLLPVCGGDDVAFILTCEFVEFHRLQN